ncbi:MAG: NAD-dependent DNA ligase LigA [Candidatus Gracilibacteria bacterium]|nr:NAD-dependent DNA ligase LigA [Candidatus Gracilibacteria bacterium]
MQQSFLSTDFSDKHILLDRTRFFLLEKTENIKIEQIDEIEEILKAHSDLYYNKEEPLISDREYDELFKKLQALEEKFGVDIETTKQVGAEIGQSSFSKVTHSRPMISLDNTYNASDLSDFDERVEKNIGDSSKKVEYIMEFKFDGLGLELIYDNGELIQAITRGNGIEGEDVTVNAFQVVNIPKKIPYKKRLEVRGEVVMPISAFDEINKKALKDGTKIFSNPRNAASGSLRLLDVSVTKERKLKYFAYDLANFDEFAREENKQNYFDVIKDLESFGFEISSYFKTFSHIEDLIKEIVKETGELKTKQEFISGLDFDIDGLVIKVNDISLWNEIGFTAHHPRYAIAYKFPADIITTKILSIEHSVARTGTITPVANLEAVNVGGVIVRRATLHNYEELREKDIMIGDNVFIKRAGEVIPEVISVIKEVRTGDEIFIPIPEICPICSTGVAKDMDKVRYYCPNHIGCPAQISGKLTYQVGKQGLNIDGLGEKQVELFIELGFINDLSDVFLLKNHREELLTQEGFKEKSVNNLLERVENSRNMNISTFLVSLAISQVGKKGAKVISKLFKNVEDILIFPFCESDFESLADIGPETAKNIVEYFRENKEFLEKYLNEININFGNASENTGKLSSLKFCITGSFDGISRDDIVKIIEENGGEFVSSVGKSTNYLIAGEKAGSKAEKAQDLGVKILSLEEFRGMI